MYNLLRVGLVLVVIFGRHTTQGSLEPHKRRLARAAQTRINTPNIERATQSQLRIDKKTFTVAETLTVDAGAYLDSKQTSNTGAVVSFQWICLKSETEINATNFHYYTTSATDQCFSDVKLAGRISGSLFQTSVRHFRFRFLPQSYFLYVIVYVSNGSVTPFVIVDVVMVTVVIGPRPVVSISCIANCAEHLNPLLPFALSIDCSNCDSTEALNYIWSIHPAGNNNTITDFDWKTSSVSGNKNRQIIVKVGAFLDVDKNETYIVTVIVIREDGAHGMAVRPLRISDAAALRLSIRAVNHKIQLNSVTTEDGSWTAIYVCIGVAVLSVIVVIGVAISYRKLSAIGHRVLPDPSQHPPPEVKRTLPEGAIDPHRATAAVDVTAVAGALAAPPPPTTPQSRAAAAATTTTTLSIMSSASMIIQSDADSTTLRKSF